jgi:CO/xanthine dehydrogenase Mo-binding subunit
LGEISIMPVAGYRPETPTGGRRWRIGLGAVGPTPLRAGEAEAALEAYESPAGIRAATELAAAVARLTEVEVDTETSEVQGLKIVSAYELGRAINPEMVRTQLEGGAVQGMSTALFESLILDQRGMPRNANFTDYRIATAVDASLETENIIIEASQDDGPFGARGIGEHPMVTTGPAIADAIFNATGVRIDSMPISSEKVWAALQDKVWQ